jgi:predicted small lipoprotein YifL
MKQIFSVASLLMMLLGITSCGVRPPAYCWQQQKYQAKMVKPLAEKLAHYQIQIDEIYPTSYGSDFVDGVWFTCYTYRKGFSDQKEAEKLAWFKTG